MLTMMPLQQNWTAWEREFLDLFQFLHMASDAWELRFVATVSVNIFLIINPKKVIPTRFSSKSYKTDI